LVFGVIKSESASRTEKGEKWKGEGVGVHVTFKEQTCFVAEGGRGGGFGAEMRLLY
jgi:hypothetical protein